MPKSAALVDVSSFTTDAKFRTWGLAMSTAAQASGLVKTSDTGQVNWATVTKPVATNTKAGYEIYRFADTLQATYPIFFRVDYGSSGVTSGSGPSTWITIGTGSDGAGVITGLGAAAFGAIQGYSGTTAPTNVSMSGYFCHVPGVAVLNFGNGITVNTANNNAGVWIISRTFDSSSGAATNLGAQLWKIASGVGVTTSVYGMNYQTATAIVSRPPVAGALYNGTPSLVSAISLPLAKQYVNVGYPVVTAAALGYYTSDIPVGTTFSLTPFGSTSRTYLAMGAPANTVDSSASANICAAVLWEDTAL